MSVNPTAPLAKPVPANWWFVVASLLIAASLIAVVGYALLYEPWGGEFGWDDPAAARRYHHAWVLRGAATLLGASVGLLLPAIGASRQNDFRPGHVLALFINTVLALLGALILLTSLRPT